MKNQLLRFKSAFIKDNEMWCVPTVLNWIFKINLKDWSVTGVCDLGLEDELYIEYIFQWDNSVWCVSAKGAKIVRYHMLIGNIESYDTETDGKRNRGAILFNGVIWIFPIELPGNVICFDINKKKYTIHDNWEKECSEKKLKGKVVSFCQDGNIVYMALMDECKILCFDLEDGKIKIKKLPGQFGLHCILKSGDEFYATSFKKRIIFQWNKETDKVKKICCPYLQNKTYVRGVGFKDKILLTDGKTVDSFCMDTRKIQPYDQIPEELRNDYETTSLFPLFFDVLIYGSKYFLIPWHANMLLEYKEEYEKWEGHTLKIPQKIFFEEYITKKLEKYSFFNEDEVGIQNFIDYISTKDVRYENGLQKHIGYNIYHQLF